MGGPRSSLVFVDMVVACVCCVCIEDVIGARRVAASDFIWTDRGSSLASSFDSWSLSLSTSGSFVSSGVDSSSNVNPKSACSCSTSGSGRVSGALLGEPTLDTCLDTCADPCLDPCLDSALRSLSALFFSFRFSSNVTEFMGSQGCLATCRFLH